MCLTRTLVRSNLFTLGERCNALVSTLILALILTTPMFGQSNPIPAPSPDYSVRVNVQEVTLDVAVQNQDGLFIPGLARENFHVTEDGVPQTITSFGFQQSRISIVLLVEYSAGGS